MITRHTFLQRLAGMSETELAKLHKDLTALNIFRGMSGRSAFALAPTLHCDIKRLRRTGEFALTCPRLDSAADNDAYYYMKGTVPERRSDHSAQIEMVIILLAVRKAMLQQIDAELARRTQALINTRLHGSHLIARLQPLLYDFDVAAQTLWALHKESPSSRVGDFETHLLGEVISHIGLYLPDVLVASTQNTTAKQRSGVIVKGGHEIAQVSWRRDLAQANFHVSQVSQCPVGDFTVTL